MFEVPVALCSSIMLSISSPTGVPSHLTISYVRSHWDESAGLSDRAILSAVLAAVSGECAPNFSPETCRALESAAGMFLGDSLATVNVAPSTPERYNMELQLARILGHCP
jgi:hypothetical protein